MGVINKRCPVMGSPVVADGGTVEYEGHKIGFCCPGCDETWNAWTDEQKRAFVEQSLGTGSAREGGGG